MELILNVTSTLACRHYGQHVGLAQAHPEQNETPVEGGEENDKCRGEVQNGLCSREAHLSSNRNVA